MMIPGELVELVGGPRDGARVPYTGEHMHERVVRKAILPLDEVGPPLDFDLGERVYVLRESGVERPVYMLKQFADMLA